MDLGALSVDNITTAASGASYTPQNIANLYVPTSWTGAPASARRSDLQTEANDYKSAYTGAYNDAYSAALSDMGSTATTAVWNRFAWEYVPSTLAWGDYQEDSAVTYSASTASPKDGTGCDLIAVAADGSLSMDATRLDYEGVPLGSPTAASRYGVGNTFGTRTATQRTCKIRRERTPELILEIPARASPGLGIRRFHTTNICLLACGLSADTGRGAVQALCRGGGVRCGGVFGGQCPCDVLPAGRSSGSACGN